MSKLSHDEISSELGSTVRPIPAGSIPQKRLTLQESHAELAEALKESTEAIIDEGWNPDIDIIKNADTALANAESFAGKNSSVK